MSDTAKAYISEARARIDAALSTIVRHSDPERLYGPVRHVLDAPGKRFRPLLAMAAGDVFKARPEASLAAGLSVEIFHTFTLVHDDIMDRSPERRGRTTVHEKWDEATAILCGDYLVGLSLEQLMGLPAERLPDVMRTFTGTIRILCEGQIRDMAFEERHDVALEEYLRMIDQKTGALLQTSLVLGGLAGEASASDFDTLRDVGFQLGRAFQIQDDLLDLIADAEAWGKPVGGDLVHGKKTFLLLTAVANAGGNDRAWFDEILRSGLSEDRIPEARQRMEAAGVLDAAREAVIFHSGNARTRIAQLPSGTGRDVLLHLADRMQERVH
ncbi:MAG: polyprenyl synthetase family protein [Rhodothermales bacterium]